MSKTNVKSTSKRRSKSRKASYAPYDANLSAKFAKRAKLKRCFNNCIMLMIFPERDGFPAERAFYVEGLIHDIAPIHHTWLELDGKIIDPTRHKLQTSKLVLTTGDPIDTRCENWTYEPRVRLTQKQACSAAANDKLPAWDKMEWIYEQMPPEAKALLTSAPSA